MKTCSVGPWLSTATVILPGFQRILLGTTLRKDAGNMTIIFGKEKKLGHKRQFLTGSINALHTIAYRTTTNKLPGFQRILVDTTL